MKTYSREKVLVVEDELIMRLDLSETIALLGRDVVHVSSADAALEILDEDASIGLVFTDIKMPGAIDGRKLAQEIRRRWPSVSVVISSANIARDAQCQTLDAPLLHKPYRLNELRGVLGPNLLPDSRTRRAGVVPESEKLASAPGDHGG